MSPSAHDAIGICRTLGVALRLDGASLAIRAPRGVMVPSLHDALRRHKQEIIAILRREDSLPPACPGSIVERIAIMTANGALEPHAVSAALAAEGFASWSALVGAWCEHISSRLTAFGPATDADIRLAKVTTAFASSHWFDDAIRLGWAEHELFGVHPGGPTVVDDYGLVSGLALGGDRGRLESLDLDGAWIMLPTGKRLRFLRSDPGLDQAVPWWECCSLADAAERRKEAA